MQGMAKAERPADPRAGSGLTGIGETRHYTENASALPLLHWPKALPMP